MAKLARQFAKEARPEDSEFAQAAYAAGLLHDLGKYSKRFQARLRNPTIRGINHWAAGARKAAEVKIPLVDYVIDGHHTGLPAASDLRQTLLKMADPELRLAATGQCSESIEELFRRFQNDGLELGDISRRGTTDKFAESLRSRMLFSCLVDADFLDTENHFDPKQSEQRISRGLEPKRALEILKVHLASKSADGATNVLRKRLLNDCLQAAEQPPGLFTLTAPTGSGKTLSSLAFALQHIVHHNRNSAQGNPPPFRRIIVVIPYTCIIEQTAKIYREDLFEPEFGADYVLEHHSAVAPREQQEDKGRDAEEDRLRRARLAAENWLSPIVVTTNVQFFESLFSNRPSDCRKLHNIAGSVVLFDEVQTLPPKLVPSLLSAVHLITRDYGVTAVFMTATQPAFASAGPALRYAWEPKEISKNEAGLANALRRTHIELPRQGEQYAWKDIATKLETAHQALCVMNTTKDARTLFNLVKESTPDGTFHLSSRMCPAHRRMQLDIIRKRLADGNPCRLISTQLIEAGVDVDFPIAYRALGPLDSIIQTAGRCNREGKHADARPVIVFRVGDGRLPPGAYALATAKTEEFLARYPDAPLHQPDTYRKYFSELYKLVGPATAEADKVFNYSNNFDFPAAADACQLVASETHPVLVRWGRGVWLAEKLTREGHLGAAECREAQRFSVNLYSGEFFEARARGYVTQPAPGWDFWVWELGYDENLGLGQLDAANFCQ